MNFKSYSIPVKLLSIIIAIILLLIFYEYFSNFPDIVSAIIGFLLILANLYFIFNFSDNYKLYTKIFIGLTLGIIFGIFFTGIVQSFLPVGQIFIRLIKMIVIPLVFASVFVGKGAL